MSNHAIETLIIGAGAAGLFCAAQLAKCGGKVRILDNGKKVGRKILMSGGVFVISPIWSFLQVVISAKIRIL